MSPKRLARLILTALGWVVGAALFYCFLAVCLAAIVVNAGMRDEPLMLAIVFGGPAVLMALVWFGQEWEDRLWYRRFARQQVQMFDHAVAEMERRRHEN